MFIKLSLSSKCLWLFLIDSRVLFLQNFNLNLSRMCCWQLLDICLLLLRILTQWLKDFKILRGCRKWHFHYNNVCRKLLIVEREKYESASSDTPIGYLLLTLTGVFFTTIFLFTNSKCATWIEASVSSYCWLVLAILFYIVLHTVYMAL